MRLIEKLRKVALELQSPTLEPPSISTSVLPPSSPVNLSSKFNTETVSCDDDGKSAPDEEEAWIEPREKEGSAEEDLEFIANPLPQIITPEQLVWAKYYVFRGALFPARLCLNKEAITEKTIKEYPIPDDKVVVEFFGQLKRGNHTRLLLVPNADLVPFWARSAKCERADYEDCSNWHLQLMDLLKKKIMEYKGNNSKGKALKFKEKQYIYSHIVKVANTFLQKALQYEKETQAILTTVSHRSSEFSRASLPETSDDKKAHRLQKCVEFLETGDEICYFDQMSNVPKFAKIVQIDVANKQQPLVLSNHDIIYMHDQVGKKPRDSAAFPLLENGRPAVPCFLLKQFLNFKSENSEISTPPRARGRPGPASAKKSETKSAIKASPKAAQCTPKSEKRARGEEEKEEKSAHSSTKRRR